MAQILVTGGAGYVGSHAVRALIRSGHSVVVLDNLVHGHREVIEQTLQVPLVVGQVGNGHLLAAILKGSHPACNNRIIDAVMHFAAYAYVGESTDKPAKYYRNNVGDSLVLLEALLSESIRRGSPPMPIVFSSTCATYGAPPCDLDTPISEQSVQRPINPYGWSKLMIEQMIADFGRSYGLPSMVFRYFNAAGADPMGDIGEDHRPETHLIPLILDIAKGYKSHINIYGDDYPTPDGTCIRDFVHVCDLAYAHVLGLHKLLEGGGQHTYNLGTGRGYSVRDVVKTAEYVTQKKYLPR